MANYMLTAPDIAEMLGVSKAKAYELIRNLNDELRKSGYIIVAGKIPRAYWETKFYSGSRDPSLVGSDDLTQQKRQ